MRRQAWVGCGALALALAVGAAARAGEPASSARPGPVEGRPAAKAVEGKARAQIVVCAPGSPGTTEEAQGAMDAFAGALAARAGAAPGALAAAYTPLEDGGVERLRAPDAAIAVVSLPFFLKHEKALRLEARLQPVPQGPQPAPEGSAGMERWTLVAKKGRVAAPAALAAFTIVSSAGYAPAFVRGPALGGYGPLPATVAIKQSAAVLSALRRAAAGEDVAVLLDGAQGAALSTLPVAPELDVVARSAPLPAGVVATVGGRIPAARWKKLEAALLGLRSEPDGAAALAGIRMERFAPLDAAALDAARKAYAEAAR